MKTSAILKQAKERLWDGHNNWVDGAMYICHAIEDVSWDNGLRPTHIYYDRRFAPYNRVKKIIQQRIQPHMCLETWVRHNVKGSWRTLNKINSSEQMQAYRHRWLDALIKEYETKGD